MTDMTPTNNFIATLTQTPRLATQLGGNLSRLKQNIDTLIQYLSYPQRIADDLTKLYNALQTASDLLSVVSVIPEVGQAASAFKNSINLLKQEILPAKNAAVSLANRVKPFITALQKLDGILANGISASQKVATGSGSFLNTFTEVATCINSLPDSKSKQTAQDYLNQFSAKAQPGTETLNTGMSVMNSTIDVLYNEMASIQQQLSPLASIENAINQVFSVLNPVISVMSELKNALMSIQIMIPIPYPHMVSLYDIFDSLGSFIDWAMKPIQDLINQLLSALHISLPSIPGLDNLLRINFNIPNIPDFTAPLQNITNLYNQLDGYIHMFKLSCPPGENQTDFRTQIGG
jgi:hypothetical protein